MNVKESVSDLKIPDSKKDSMMSKYVNDGVSDHRDDLETPNILKTNQVTKEQEKGTKSKYTHEYK